MPNDDNDLAEDSSKRKFFQSHGVSVKYPDDENALWEDWARNSESDGGRILRENIRNVLSSGKAELPQLTAALLAEKAWTQQQLRQLFPSGIVSVYRSIYGDYARGVLEKLKSSTEIDVSVESITSYTSLRNFAKDVISDEIESATDLPALVWREDVPIEDVWSSSYTNKPIRDYHTHVSGLEGSSDEFVVGSPTGKRRIRRDNITDMYDPKTRTWQEKKK